MEQESKRQAANSKEQNLGFKATGYREE